ncbi:hypothetical protein [Klebsiella pneumoniae]|uniref:hypothetical protein n=1 Tax=Klebsiella pneumoniae TaxID=573 RepID=UPI00298CDBE9|nr:hypothetical protein [Klebsiella pneumoniae]MDW5754319.1 hypothetical protein [Klebsiella pneumoniae]HBQ7250078.1 hypothetical protein [Klebsiella pneumoniae]HBQ7296472.1 hypothetical protein [Klebsiella pneumoniae]HBQ7484303.1 hypothetical protein [Klebsiella pneumoniae]HBY9057533.1 hypothetical protein [Klebsiella pneumoniae]
MTITLQAVNELIASLESAGEPSIREQKFLKLAKAYQQLAAENVGLKAGRKFFMYSDDSGFETFETQEEAFKAAQEMIDACREDAYDGWPEEADSIRWGIVIQQATETDFEKPAPENGWEGSSDYKLLPETPATDAFLAGIKADGVEEFAESQKEYVRQHRNEMDQMLRAAYAGSAVDAERFAKQLREGDDK